MVTVYLIINVKSGTLQKRTLYPGEKCPQMKRPRCQLFCYREVRMHDGKDLLLDR